MNIAEIRELDTATVPVEDIPRICYHAATIAATLKRMLGDCEDVVKELNARVDGTLLKDLEKVETEFGTYTRTTRTNMVLPKDENDNTDKSLVLRYVVDQVNAGTPIDEAFAILSTSLKKSGFDELIDPDSELDKTSGQSSLERTLGIGRSDQTTVKFTPKKKL